MSEDNKEHRSAFRYVLVWALGVIQVVTTAAVIAGVGSLWTLSTTMAALVVEISTIKADVTVTRLRQDKTEAEVKRVSDEQIRRGVILEQLRGKK
jgi:hypothetical protein